MCIGYCMGMMIAQTCCLGNVCAFPRSNRVPSLHLQTSSSPWSWSKSWQLWSQWWKSGTCWDCTWACLALWWKRLKKTIPPLLRGRWVWFRSGCQSNSSVPPGALWWRLCVKLAWILLQEISQRSTVSVLWHPHTVRDVLCKEKWTWYSMFCREMNKEPL